MIQQVQHFTPNLPKLPFKHNKQQKIDLSVNNDESNKHHFIVNADDYAISQPRSKGILELIKQKKVTSISVLVSGVNQTNVALWCQLLKDYIFDPIEGVSNDRELLNHQNQYLLKKVSVGLHFNLTQGPALCTTIPNTLLNQQTKHLQGKTFIYEYLAKENNQNQPFPLSMQQFIKTQLRMQIQKFIQLFSFRPSHIDGHNHVHVIPQVAQLIAPIMRQIGIYRTRLPLQELQAKNQKNQIFANNARRAKPILDKYQLIYPTTFLGCQQINRLDINNIERKILKKINENYQGDNRFVELMCHPGYTDQLKGDEFNRHKGRQIELNSLKSQEFVQTIQKNSHFKLSNFNYLSPPVTQSTKPRILLYSKMSKGCGNWTTSLRLEQIFQSLGYEVYLRSIEENIQTEFQIQSLRMFSIQFRISLVIGVNLTRSGRVVYHATRSPSQLTNRVPYIFIVAGTDANIYFNNPQAATVLKEPLENCEMLISLSENMVKLTQQFLLNKLKFNQCQLPIILLSQSSNILGFEKPTISQRQKVHRCLKQNYNLDIGKDKYIVFPASFRPVKDIQFLLKDFNQLIAHEQNKLRVLILGPVLDKEYYEKCLSQMGKVQYLGSLQKQLYLEVLKHAFLLVNSSISQGQCCSIQQAHEVGQISVVRANQGNSELVEHMKTGFLFSTQEEFLAIYETLDKNENNIRETIKLNALQYHKENFSVEAEAKQYQKIFSKLLPNHDSLFTYPDVHGLSQINLALYKQVPQQFLVNWFNNSSKKRVIDMGCGSGIFGMTLLEKFPQQLQQQIKLQMYDYNASVISNCYYNCLQQLSLKLKHVNSLRLQVSDMFSNVQNPDNDGNLIVANMPQTPFQKQSSRPDKNGGIDSMKFNQHLIRKFSTFNKESVLVMLYSYMCQPIRFFELLSDLNLKIVWRSARSVFRIASRAYDQMQENLSSFLKEHIKSGKAQVEIIQENGQQIFIVPAEIFVIQKINNSL